MDRLAVLGCRWLMRTVLSAAPAASASLRQGYGWSAEAFAEAEAKRVEPQRMGAGPDAP
jgi:hypothetical protein